MRANFLRAGERPQSYRLLGIATGRLVAGMIGARLATRFRGGKDMSTARLQAAWPTCSRCDRLQAAVLLSIALHGVAILVAACFRLQSTHRSGVVEFLAASQASEVDLEVLPRFAVPPLTPMDSDIQHVVPDVAVPHLQVDSRMDSVAGSEGARMRPSEVGRILRAAGWTASGKNRGSGAGPRGQGDARGGQGVFRPFNKMLEDLKRGLDLVIVFDSTSSMGPEIEALKFQFLRLGQLMLRALPNTRIACVTYKDVNDPIPVAYTPLTSDLQQIHRFLRAVEPYGGGADIPEAVHLGVFQATRGYAFREDAVRVILLFGDAPPHQQEMVPMLLAVQAFAAHPKAFLSSVTVRASQPLLEFQLISAQGRGEAVALIRPDRVVQELFLLVFKQVNRGFAMQLLQLQ